MNTRKIAVLLATYNGEDYIERQIASILAQSNVVVHIFISDDRSSDRTPEVIRKICDTSPRVSCINYDEKFGSAAKNFFWLVCRVDVADFDFVAFADQDDIWHLDKLQTAVAEMETHGACGYSSDVIAYWPVSGKKRLVKKSYDQTHLDQWFESPGPGCSQVFKSRPFQAFQAMVRDHYDQIMKVDYHDWLVYAYFRHHSFPWYISDKPKMLYVQHKNNQIGANIGFSQHVKRLKLIRSKWYRQQVELIHAIVANTDRPFVAECVNIGNAFLLRRKKSHSIVLFFFFKLGIF